MQCFFRIYVMILTCLVSLSQENIAELSQKKKIASKKVSFMHSNNVLLQ